MGLLNQLTNGRAVMRAANPSDPGPERIRKLYEEGVAKTQQRLQESLDFGRHREVREVLKSGDVPGSPGDRAFAALHRVEVWDDPSMSHTDNERIFRGANIAQSSRSPSYGYRAGEDARRYDALKEGAWVTDEELAEFEEACAAETEPLEAIAEMTDEEFDEFVKSLSDEERETLRSLLQPDTEEEVREQVAAPVSGPRRIIQIMREQREHQEGVVFPAVAEAVAKQIASSVADGTEPTPQFIHAVALRILEEHDMGRPALPRFAAWARTLDGDEVKNLMRG